MTKLRFLIWFATIPLTVCILLACTDDSTRRFDGDYFPINDKQSWSYQREAMMLYNFVWDTLTLTTHTDTVFDGKNYKKLVNEYGYTERLIRVAGPQYYIRTHDIYRPANGMLAAGYSEEYLFLDCSKPVGYSWIVTNNGITPSTKYIIKSKLASMEVNSHVYYNVIEVEVQHFIQEGNDLKLWRTGHSFYAKDTGEIYRFEPSPFTTLYIDLSYRLITK